MSYYQIAEKLTKNHIPTASMLRQTKRKGKYASLGYWSTKTVKGILSNRLYLGDMIQNRNQRIIRIKTRRMNKTKKKKKTKKKII